MADELIHEIIPVGLLQCNCSILGDPATGEAIVVDPGDEVDRILEILRRHELKVRAIVSTHTHIDHVGGLAALHRATKAPVLIHEADMDLYRALDQQAQWLGVPTPEVMRIEDFVKEGDKLRWGKFAAQILHTPGHTPGSISLIIGPETERPSESSERNRHWGSERYSKVLNAPSRLIAGDTLFQGSVGRTDLPGSGTHEQMIQSIRDKLLVLSDDLLVVPGHGANTTIGAERACNPFLR